MMRAFVVVVALLLPVVAQADEAPHYRFPVGIALVSPAEVFHGEGKIVVGASVNLIYGRSHSVYGVEVGLVNRVDHDVGILQVGGLVNYAEGGCYGVCVAGIGNYHGSLVGIQAALLGNEAENIPFGFQFSFLNVIRRNSAMAVQVGAVNINNRHLVDIVALMGAKQGDVVTIHLTAGRQTGMQIGIVNGSDNYRGLRLAAVMNVGDKGSGVEVAAIGNVASEWSGLQIGAWNHATKMHGLQIGLINTARELEGIQIGVLNIATANTIPFTVLINAGW